jgi:exo-beta-1,3-glucanase (GH17 family)
MNHQNVGLGRRRRLDQQQQKSRVRIWSTTMLPVLTLAWMIMVAPSCGDYAIEPQMMGVNYGQVGDNLPSNDAAVNLIKSLGAGRVKIYNSDAGTLTALAKTGLEVVIGMSNDEIPSLAASSATADEWIVANVVAYVPATNITVILVGNELFADPTNSNIWPQLVPAIQNLQTSLTSHGLSSIKLSTACEFNILTSSFPPSAGVFNSQIAVPVLKPLLEFLDKTSSYLYINIYPYFAWADNPSSIPLNYAVFASLAATLTEGQYSYTSLLEAQIDAVYYAMEALGYKNVRIALSESGWPTAGGTGANIRNAEAYNNNLVTYILSGKGTPKRPRVFIPTYIFALFNEDLKPGPATEQHWGLLYPNGSAVYPISLAGGSSPGDPSFPLPSPDGTGSNSDLPAGKPDACGDRESVLPLSVTFLGMLFNLRI